MPVTVTLQANALTNLAAVLDELDLTSDGGVVDSRLNRYINAASDFIARECDRVFEKGAGIVEHLPGFGLIGLRPKRVPITAITSIVIDGSAADSATYTLADDGESIIMRTGWPWTAAWSPEKTRRAAGSEYPDIVVTFDGGFVTPKQHDDDNAKVRTLPSDLEDACIQLAVTRYRHKGRDVTERARSFEASGLTFGGEPIAPEIAAILDHYRRIPNA